MDNQSTNPYKKFKNSKTELELTKLLKAPYSLLIMEKFVEYGIPPVGALSKEAEEIYNSIYKTNSYLKTSQHEFNKYFGYLVGQELGKIGYKKSGSRGKLKSKFFKTGTKFIKNSQSKNYISESPFAKLAGIAKIGTMSNDEIDNTIYGS
ncbi:hypothetical protein BH10BAC5_BH10BAC5_28120 [soil metagenome]